MTLQSIDELLLNPDSQPEPEHKPETERAPDPEPEAPESPEPKSAPESESEPEPENDNDDGDSDEYGNPIKKQEPKTYTEDEVNERINRAVRERMDRMERNKPTQEQKQQAEQAGFEYDRNAEGNWQQQLKDFIAHTYKEITQEEQQEKQRQAQEQQMQREQAAMQDYEQKFSQGMQRFDDFIEVVGNKQLTDPMVLASRSMRDPAAFFYAAAKNHSAELDRISKLSDPYQQMTEIGRLEERMKKSKPTSKAPKPISRVTGDMSDRSDESRNIDDLIMLDAKQKFSHNR
jgi:hypothetical protein